MNLEESDVSWELKFEIIGRVICTTEVFDVDVELNRPYCDKPLKEIDNIENKFKLNHYRPSIEIQVTEFDSRLLQIYFNFNALRLTITFKEMSVRQCSPDELDLYMLNRPK